MITIKAYFITFGCKVNLYETENMKELFRREGFEISESENGADIFVINSCTVTSASDKKIKQELRRLRRENPDSAIALTGCFPQAFEEEAKKLSEADIVLGTKNRSELAGLVKKHMLDKAKIVQIAPHIKGEHFESMKNAGYGDKTRAFMKIQDGCDQFCSYCIIPYSRGRVRSKPIEDIIEEATQFAKSGHKELVLVGINLSFYGKEFGLSLADAVEVCCKIDGIERVRLGSLEPEMMTDDEINRLAAQKKLCPHFHLSLQSGCDKTLKEMNRKYTSGEFYNLVCKLRGKFEDCAITTDVMVGFPGETDDDFKASLEFVKKVCFDKVHVFPYSIRKGTAAAKRPEQIPEEIKKQRARLMSQLADECMKQNLQKQIGKIYPVLFERENCTEFHQGHAPNYTLIKIPAEKGDNSLRGQIFYVKINRIEKDFCIGEKIKENQI
jgi:threonylcarbamoyladenosine tRNA methylthiotransferase MtaB